MANHILGEEQGENGERFGEGFPMKQDMRGNQKIWFINADYIQAKLLSLIMSGIISEGTSSTERGWAMLRRH